MNAFEPLEKEFLYFTESNLATSERLQTLTRSSKSERQRQINICNGMLKVCRDFIGTSASKWTELQRLTLPRTVARLSDPTADKP